jgi:hypothetical protein
MATTLSKSNPTPEVDQTGSPNASLRAVPIRLRRRRGSDAGRDSGDDDSNRVRAPVRPAIRAARAYRRTGDRRGEPPRRSAGAPSKECHHPGALRPSSLVKTTVATCRGTAGRASDPADAGANPSGLGGRDVGGSGRRPLGLLGGRLGSVARSGPGHDSTDHCVGTPRSGRHCVRIERSSRPAIRAWCRVPARAGPRTARAPGLTMIVPIVDHLRKDSLQIVTMPVPAQE